MSQEIDQKIVEMRFDNRQFEERARESIQTLQDLDNAFNISARPLNESLEEAGHQFSIFETIALGALLNIGKRISDLGLNMVKDLSIKQITTGWSKYEQEMDAVHTIMATTVGNFKDEAEQMAYVNKQLDKMAWYADETSFSYNDMVGGISKFVSNNVELEKAADAMQGISSWTAKSGGKAEQASRAIYNLSQALSIGKVNAMDWKSIELANMATPEFKMLALESAKALGTVKESVNGLYQSIYSKGKEPILFDSMKNFRESLTEDWFDANVLMETLSKYGKFSSLLYEAQEKMGIDTSTELLRMLKEFEKGTLNTERVMKQTGLSADDLNHIFRVLTSDAMKYGRAAFQAGQETKTFSEAINATKESVSSGWKNTFKILFGDYLEAKSLWSSFTEEMIVVFTEGIHARNEMLADWKELGGRNKFIEGVVAGWTNLKEVLRSVKDAFRDVFPPMTGEKLYKITEGFAKLMQSLKPSEETLDKLRRAFRGVFSVFGSGWEIIKAVGKALSPLTAIIKPIFGVLLDGAAKLGDYLYQFNQFLVNGDVLTNVSTFISNGLKSFLQGAKDILTLKISPVEAIKTKFTEWYNNFKNIDWTTVFDSNNILKFIKDSGIKVQEKIKGIWDAILNFFRNITTFKISSNKNIFTDIFNGAKNMFQKFIEKINNLFSIKLKLPNTAKIGEKFKAFFKGFGTMFKNFGSFLKGGIKDVYNTFFEPVVTFLREMFKGMTSVIKEGSPLRKILGLAGDIIIGILEGVKKIVGDGNIDNLLASIRSFLRIFLLWEYIKVVKKMPEMMGGISKGFDQAALAFKDVSVSVSGMFTSVTELVQGFRKKQKVKSFKAFAKSMLVIGGSVFLIATALEKLKSVPYETIGLGSATILAVLGGVAMIAKHMETTDEALANNSKVIRRIKPKFLELVGISLIIKELGTALSKIGSQENWLSILTAFPAITGTIRAVSGMITNLTAEAKKIGPSTALAFWAISKIIKSIGNALSIMADRAWVSLSLSTASMMATLMAVGLILKAIPERVKPSVILALISIRHTFLVLSGLALMLSLFKIETLLKASAVIGGMMLLVSAATSLARIGAKENVDYSGIAKLASALSKSLMKIIIPLSLLSLLSPGSLFKAVTTMSAIFAVLANATKAMNKIPNTDQKKGVRKIFTIDIIVRSLMKTIPSLYLLSFMSTGAIIKSLIAMKVIFSNIAGLLKYAFAMDGKVDRSNLFALTESVKRLALSFLGFAAVTKIFGSMKVTEILKGMAAIAAVALGLKYLIPKLQELNQRLTFEDASKKAGSFIRALRKVTFSLLGLAAAFAAFKFIFGKDIEVFVADLGYFLASFGKALLNFITEFIRDISKTIPTIVDLLFDTLINAIRAAKPRVEELVAEVIALLAEVLKGIDEAVKTYSLEVIQKIGLTFIGIFAAMKMAASIKKTFKQSLKGLAMMGMFAAAVVGVFSIFALLGQNEGSVEFFGKGSAVLKAMEDGFKSIGILSLVMIPVISTVVALTKAMDKLKISDKKLIAGFKNFGIIAAGLLGATMSIGLLDNQGNISKYSKAGGSALREFQNAIKGLGSLFVSVSLVAADSVALAAAANKVGGTRQILEGFKVFSIVAGALGAVTFGLGMINSLFSGGLASVISAGSPVLNAMNSAFSGLWSLFGSISMVSIAAVLLAKASDSVGGFRQIVKGFAVFGIIAAALGSAVLAVGGLNKFMDGGLATYLDAGGPALKALNSALKGLSTLFSSVMILAGASVILGKIGDVGKTLKGLGVFGLIVGAVGLATAAIGGLFAKRDISIVLNTGSNFFIGLKGAMSGLAGLIVGAISLGAAAAAFGTIGAAALAGMGPLIGFIAAVGAFTVVLGAINQIPGLEGLVRDGGRLLTEFGGALGGFIGGVVGGLIGGTVSQLTQIGIGLSSFMTNAEPFFKKSAEYGKEGFGLLETFIGSLLTLSKAGALDAITFWHSNITTLEDFAVGMNKIAPELEKFINGMKKFSSKDVEGVNNATQALFSVVGVLMQVPDAGGAIQDVFGEKSLIPLANGLSAIGPALNTFAYYTQGITEQNVSGGTSAMKTLAAVSRNLPESGGMWQHFAGEKNLALFAESMALAAPYVLDFAKTVKDVKSTDASGAASTIRAMNDVAKELVETNHSFSQYDATVMGKLGRDLTSLGSSFKGFASAEIEGVPSVMDNLSKSMVTLYDAFDKLGGIDKEKYQSLGKDIVQRVISGLNDQLSMEQLRTTVKNFYEKITNIMARVSNPKIFESHGVNIVAGLHKGIASGAPQVMQYVTDFANAISRKFKRVMAIKSPSRVFMGHGENITKGLIIGMGRPNLKKGVFTSLIQPLLSTATNLPENSFAGSGKKLIQGLEDELDFSKLSSIKNPAIEGAKDTASAIFETFEQGMSRDRYKELGQGAMSGLGEGLQSPAGSKASIEAERKIREDKVQSLKESLEKYNKEIVIKEQEIERARSAGDDLVIEKNRKDLDDLTKRKESTITQIVQLNRELSTLEEIQKKQNQNGFVNYPDTNGSFGQVGSNPKEEAINLKIEEKQAKIREMERDLREYEGDISRKEKEVLEYRNLGDTLRMTKAQDELVKLHEKKGAANRGIRRLQLDIRNLEKEKEKLNKELNDFTGRGSWKADVDQLEQTDVVDDVVESEQKKQEVYEAMAKFKKYRNSQSEALAELSDKEYEYFEKLGDNNEKVVQLESKLLEKSELRQTKIDELKARIEANDETLTAREKERREAEIKRLNDDIRNLAEQKRKLESDISKNEIEWNVKSEKEEKKAVQETAKQLTDAIKSYKEASSKITEEGFALAQAQAELQNIEKQITEYSAAGLPTHELRLAKAEKLDEIEEINSKILEHNSVLEETVEKVTQLQTVLDPFSNKYSDIIGDLLGISLADVNSESQSKVIFNSIKELQKAHDEYNKTEKDLKGSYIKLQTHRADLARLQGQLKKAQDEGDYKAVLELEMKIREKEEQLTVVLDELTTYQNAISEMSGKITGIQNGLKPFQEYINDYVNPALMEIVSPSVDLSEWEGFGDELIKLYESGAFNEQNLGKLRGGGGRAAKAAQEGFLDYMFKEKEGLFTSIKGLDDPTLREMVNAEGKTYGTEFGTGFNDSAIDTIGGGLDDFKIEEPEIKIDDTLNKMKGGFLTKFLTKVKNGETSVDSAMGELMDILVSTGNGNLKKYLPNLRQLGDESIKPVIEGIANGTVSVEQAVGMFMSSFANNTEENVTSNLQKFKKAGGVILDQGLLGGVKEKADDVTKTGKGTVSIFGEGMTDQETINAIQEKVKNKTLSIVDLFGVGSEKARPAGTAVLNQYDSGLNDEQLIEKIKKSAHGINDNWFESVYAKIMKGDKSSQEVGKTTLVEFIKGLGNKDKINELVSESGKRGNDFLVALQKALFGESGKEGPTEGTGKKTVEDFKTGIQNPQTRKALEIEAGLTGTNVVDSIKAMLFGSGQEGDNPVHDSGLGVLSTLVKALSNQQKQDELKGAGDKAGTAMFVGITDEIKSDKFTNPIETAVSNIGLKFKESVGKFIQNFVDTGIQMVRGLIKGLKDENENRNLTYAAEELATTANTATRKAAFIRSPSRLFEQTGEYMVEGLRQGLQSDQPGIYKDGKQMAQGVARGLEENLPKDPLGDFSVNSESMGNSIISGLKDGIQDNTYIATDGVKNLTHTFNSEFDKSLNIDRYRIIGSDILRLLNDGLRDLAKATLLQETIVYISNHIKETFHNALNVQQYYDLGARIGKNLAEGIRSQVGAVKSAISELSSSAGSTNSDNGYQVMNGLAKGIENGTPKVKRTFKIGMGRAILQNAQKTLRIHSPSKWAIGIGSYVMEGLAIGISGGQDGLMNAVNTNMLNPFDLVRDSLLSLEDMDGFNPVITPVVDLSNIDNSVARMNKAFRGIDVSSAFINASDAINRANESKSKEHSAQPTSVTHNWNMEQHNHSPKALSRVDIYRQTRSQFRTLRGVVESNI